MKVLCCEDCTDVVGMTTQEWRNCSCERCGGMYERDGDKVVVGGPCFIVAFQNGLRAGLISRGQA